MEKINFLPEDYEIPSAPSNYARFQAGANKFRILGTAITGYEYFNSDNKPVRSKEEFETVVDLKKNGKVKVFWAFPVYNYQIESIQVLELTQKSIMKVIRDLTKDPAWGSPFNYDIVISKEGEGLDTEYSTVPNPPSEVSDKIKEAFMEKPINLDALFSGKDPFKNE